MENVSSTRTVPVENKRANQNNTKGTIAALAGAQAVSMAAAPASIVAIKGLVNSSKGLDEFQKSDIKKAAQTILDTTGLTQKGVKLNDYRNAGANFTSIPDKALELLNPIYGTANGKNAFFGGIKGTKSIGGERLFANEVVCNMDKLPTAIFHEMGHAFNANNSKFWKAVQGMRGPAMALGAGIALFCAFTKKSKPSDNANGELTGAQKAKNFVRENSGKLAFLSMVPVLAEEGLATIRGNNWAKQMLSPDMAKKVAKGNKFGFITYLASAAAIGLAAHCATKIKDHFTEKENNRPILYSHQG